MHRQEANGQNPSPAEFIEEQKKALQIRHKTMPLQENELQEEKLKLGMLDDFYGFCLKHQAVSAGDCEELTGEWLGGQQKKIEKLVHECSLQIGRVLGFLHEAWQDDAEYLQLIEAMTQHEVTVLFLHEYPQKLYEEYIPRLILEDETKALLQEVKALEKNKA